MIALTATGQAQLSKLNAAAEGKRAAQMAAADVTARQLHEARKTIRMLTEPTGE